MRTLCYTIAIDTYGYTYVGLPPKRFQREWISPFFDNNYRLLLQQFHRTQSYKIGVDICLFIPIIWVLIWVTHHVKVSACNLFLARVFCNPSPLTLLIPCITDLLTRTSTYWYKYNEPDETRCSEKERQLNCGNAWNLVVLSWLITFNSYSA